MFNIGWLLQRLDVQAVFLQAEIHLLIGGSNQRNGRDLLSKLLDHAVVDTFDVKAAILRPCQCGCENHLVLRRETKISSCKDWPFMERACRNFSWTLAVGAVKPRLGGKYCLCNIVKSSGIVTRKVLA